MTGQLVAGSSYSSKLRQLTKDQLLKVEQLKAEVDGILKEHPVLQFFCIDWTYVRYLQARSWNVPHAAKMLKDTLEWRVQEKIHEIRWEQVKHEGQTGKTFLTPFFDNDGRPVVILRPRNENTKPSEMQNRHLIYVLEQACAQADRLGVGKMTWLLDFGGYDLRTAPPIKVSVAVLHMLQNHYPERLGLSLCYHAPALFSVTWKVVSAFIDPNTKKKVSFVNKTAKEDQEMSAHFNLDELEECMGGTHKGPVFEMTSYTSRMNQLDQQYEQELSTFLRSLSQPVLQQQVTVIA